MSRNAITPLPSLIRASAQDASNMHMRKAGRSRWNDDDWNVMCATQERLIRACYGRPSDHNEPRLCFVRFQIAERMERSGRFTLTSDLNAILAEIDGEHEAAPARRASAPDRLRASAT